MGSKSYSKGISWIDDCRIPFVDEVGFKSPQHNKNVFNKDYPIEYDGNFIMNTQGRFPANLLVSDDMLNDGVISKSVKGRNDIGSSTYGGNSLLNSKTKMNNTDRGFNDKGSNSRYYNIDKWFDNLISE
jgi:hypothetical protein